MEEYPGTVDNYATQQKDMLFFNKSINNIIKQWGFSEFWDVMFIGSDDFSHKDKILDAVKNKDNWAQVIYEQSSWNRGSLAQV